MRKRVFMILASLFLLSGTMHAAGPSPIIRGLNMPEYGDRHASVKKAATAFGDLLFEWDIQSLTGDPTIYGVEYLPPYFYITGGNSWYPPHKIFRFNENGAYLDYFIQPGNLSEWGMGDLAWDGTYLYGGGADCIIAFDTQGNLVRSFPSPLPETLALEYDPVAAVFYLSHWDSNLIYIVKDDGTVVDSFSTGSNQIQGLAWDDYSPGGPWLWAASFYPSTILQIDPVSRTFTGVSIDTPWIETLPAGLDFTSDWPQAGGRGILLGIAQENSDFAYGVEIADCIQPLIEDDGTFESALGFTGTAGYFVQCITPSYPSYLIELSAFIDSQTEATGPAKWSVWVDPNGNGPPEGQAFWESPVTLNVGAWNTIDLLGNPAFQTPITSGSWCIGMWFDATENFMAVGRDTDEPTHHAWYNYLGTWETIDSVGFPGNLAFRAVSDHCGAPATTTTTHPSTTTTVPSTTSTTTSTILADDDSAGDDTADDDTAADDTAADDASDDSMPSDDSGNEIPGDASGGGFPASGHSAGSGSSGCGC